MQITNTQPDIRFYANGDILIRKHASQKLDIANGDAICILECNGESFLYISIKNAPPSFSGIAKSRSGSYFRVRWKALTKHILNGNIKAYYRVGDIININGTPCLPIITRKNYATTTNQL